MAKCYLYKYEIRVYDSTDSVNLGPLGMVEPSSDMILFNLDFLPNFDFFKNPQCTALLKHWYSMRSMKNRFSVWYPTMSKTKLNQNRNQLLILPL